MAIIGKGNTVKIGGRTYTSKGFVPAKKKTSSSSGNNSSVKLTFASIDPTTGVVTKSTKPFKNTSKSSGKSTKASSGGILGGVITTMQDTKANTITTTYTPPVLNSSIKKAFTDAKLNFLTKSYNDNQLKQIANNLLKQTDASKTVMALSRIESNRNLSTLQKETAKIKVLGLNDKNFAKKIKDIKQKQINEIKKSMNTISVGDTRRNLSLGYLNDIENYFSRKYNSILNKPVRNRTTKEMALIIPTGLFATGLSVINQVPGIVWRNVEAIFSPVQTSKGIYNIITNASERKKLQNSLARLGQAAKNGNPQAIASIIAEIVVAKASIKKISQQVSKISPKYVKGTGESFVLKNSNFASVKTFLRSSSPKIFKPFIKDPNIILKKQTFKSGASTLAEQTKLAGETVTAVNASANRLTSWIKRKQIVRKPFNLTGLKSKFPKGELSFPTKIKTILNKFDNGTKLTKKEFAKVNLWLQKNIAPNTTLLERSLYLDPAKGLRVSRLQISKAKKATFKDILKRNFSLFDRQKPQVLIFENAKVAKFPKTLKAIEKKLKGNKKLTTKETNKLIEWQVQTGSGKFKPIGSTIYKGGIELEVTLAPGEYIKRVKRIGFTYIEGKKVDFVKAEIWKPSKAILKRIEKAKKGKLTNKQLTTLEKELSKKLGRKIKVDNPKLKLRRTNIKKPVLRIKGRGIRIIRKPTTRKPTTRKPTVRKPTTRKPTTKKPTTKKPTTRKPTTKKPTTRKPTTKKPTTRKPTVRKPTTKKPTTRKPTTRKPTVRKPTIRKPIIGKPPVRGIVKLTSFDKLKKDQVAQFVGKYRERKYLSKPYNKRTNPVIVKNIRVKTTKNRLLNILSKKIDNSTARSIEVKIAGITNKIKKDINKPKRLGKFRIKKGKNSKVLKLVEKSKYTIDTKGEVKGLRKVKRKKIKKKVKLTTKRKKSSKIKSKKKTVKRKTKSKSKKK